MPIFNIEISTPRLLILDKCRNFRSWDAFGLLFSTYPVCFSCKYAENVRYYKVYNNHVMTTMSQRQPTWERRCILLFLKLNSAGFTTETNDFIQHKPI